MSRIDDYNPDHNLINPNDIKYIQSESLSINSFEYVYKSKDVLLYDVPGKRSQRKKWNFFLKDCNHIIFFIPLNHFYKKMDEDDITNRLLEDIMLLKEIKQNNDISHILILSKFDEFFKNHQNYSKEFKEAIKLIINHFNINIDLDKLEKDKSTNSKIELIIQILNSLKLMPLNIIIADLINDNCFQDIFEIINRIVQKELTLNEPYYSLHLIYIIHKLDCSFGLKDIHFNFEKSLVPNLE